jgi:hypothetical protein
VSASTRTPSWYKKNPMTVSSIRQISRCAATGSQQQTEDLSGHNHHYPYQAEMRGWAASSPRNMQNAALTTSIADEAQGYRPGIHLWRMSRIIHGHHDAWLDILMMTAFSASKHNVVVVLKSANIYWKIGSKLVLPNGHYTNPWLYS